MLLELGREPEQRQRRIRRLEFRANQDQAVERGLPEVDRGRGAAKLQLDRTEGRPPRNLQDRVGDPDEPHPLSPRGFAQVTVERDLCAEQVGEPLEGGIHALLFPLELPGELDHDVDEPRHEALDGPPQHEHRLRCSLELGGMAQEPRRNEAPPGMLKQRFDTTLAGGSREDDRPEAVPLGIAANKIRKGFVEDAAEQPGRGLPHAAVLARGHRFEGRSDVTYR